MTDVMTKKWDKKGKVCTHCAARDYQECDHVRGGKTKYERETGANHNRLNNRSQRESWQKSGGVFPRGTCNGQKNRFLK